MNIDFDKVVMAYRNGYEVGRLRTARSTFDIYKSGQIKKIEKFYPKLIRITAENCKTNNLTLREFDQKTFALKL